MKYSWLKRGLLLFVLVSSSSKACELDEYSSWFWPEAKLPYKTKEIVVAQLVSEEPTSETAGALKADMPRSVGDTKQQLTKWTFKVDRVIKGPKDQDTFSIVAGKSAGKIIDREQGSCAPLFRFEKEKFYLIFRDSYHPAGYQISDIAKIKAAEKHLKRSHLADIIVNAKPILRYGSPKDQPQQEQPKLSDFEIVDAVEANEQNTIQACVDSSGILQAAVYGSIGSGPIVLAVFKPKAIQKHMVRRESLGEHAYRNSDVSLNIELDVTNTSLGVPSLLLVKQKDGSRSKKNLFCRKSDSSPKEILSQLRSATSRK